MTTASDPKSFKRRSIRILAALTLIVLLLLLPQSIQYARQNRTHYLFSRAFVEDIPKQLEGPGRFKCPKNIAIRPQARVSLLNRSLQDSNLHSSVP